MEWWVIPVGIGTILLQFGQGEVGMGMGVLQDGHGRVGVDVDE
jgi:hypothetical protein